MVNAVFAWAAGKKMRHNFALLAAATNLVRRAVFHVAEVVHLG
jgi:hypothetical protein